MPSEKNINSNLKEFFQPIFKVFFDRVRQIKDPVKIRILQQLLDGNWHDENELVRLIKKYRFIGPVGIGMLVEQIRRLVNEDFLLSGKGNIPTDSKYKLNDNYVGLTRAAFHTFSRSFPANW